MSLISRLEDRKRERLENETATTLDRIELAALRMDRHWMDNLCDFAGSGSMDAGVRSLRDADFLRHLPAECLDGLLPGGLKDEGWGIMRKVDFLTRAQRRYLWGAKKWMVHLYAGGEGHHQFFQLDCGDTAVIELDIQRCKGHDVMSAPVWRMLMWGAVNGKIDGVIGGPPGRGGVNSFVDSEDKRGLKPMKLIARMMWLYATATAARQSAGAGGNKGRPVAFMLEHPAKEMCKGTSLWDLPMWTEFQNDMDMNQVTFDQGSMGGEAIRTTLGTNVYYLMGLDQVGVEGDVKDDYLAGSSGVWSSGFVSALVLAMKFWDRTPRCCPTLARLTAEQWKRHIQSNHADYQRDCLACVMGRGTGRRHGRVRHPDMFNLTVDVAGPVKPGLDVTSKGALGKGLRYMMVAKYTLPTEYVKGYTGRTPPDDHGLDQGQDEQHLAGGVEKELQPDKEIARPSLPQPHEGGVEQQLASGVEKELQPDQEIARPSLPQPHEGGVEQQLASGVEKELQPDQEIARPSLPQPHEGGVEQQLASGVEKELQPDQEIARPSLPQPHEGGVEQQLASGVEKELQPDKEIARPSLPQPHEGGGSLLDELEQSRGDPFAVDELEQSRGDPLLDWDDHYLQVKSDQAAADGFVGSSRKQQQEYEDYEDSMYEPSLQDEDELEDRDGGVHGGPLSVEPRTVIQDCEAPESTYLLFARPLVANGSGLVKAAIQDVVLYLQARGLPVYRLHSDKGEVYCHSIRSWLRDQGIRATFSEPGIPQGNGAAEATVRWLKDRARTMLIGARLPTRLWPTAVEAAAAQQRSKVLGGRCKLLVPYGAPVYLKQKAFDSSGPRRRERAFETRWIKGRYVGLSNLLDNGHVVFVPGGDGQREKFLHTFHVRTGLVDPGDPVGEELHDEPPKPRRRLPEKTSPEKIDFKLLSLSMDDQVQYIRDRSRVLLNEWNQEGAISFVSELADHGFFDDLKFGVFRHGGSVGWLKNFKEYPELTRVLSGIIHHDHPEATFTAIMVAKGNEKGMHKDFNNDEDAVNYVMPISIPRRGGELWVELGQGDKVSGSIVERRDDQDRPHYGQLYPLLPGKCNVFSPRRLHEVLPWDGKRTVLIGYTPQGLGKITSEMVRELEEFGFTPPLTQYPEYFLLNHEDSKTEVNAKKLDAPCQEEFDFVADFQAVDSDIEEWEMYLDTEQGAIKVGDARNFEDSQDFVSVKKVDVTYTKGVEDIIANLKGPLEVTYTVDPREVYEHLEGWAPAIKKEVEGVAVAIKRLLPQTDERAEWFRRPGAQRLPAKLVFTVKPGDAPLPDRPDTWYKRKARLVVCGNFATSSEGDLYSETAPSEAVRVGLTMTRKRRWVVGLIDIMQAFLRTPLDPLSGDPTIIVAPPRVLEKLSMIRPGELWGLVRALYGLRQAPALWTAHRDRVLREMVFPGQLHLRQGRTITAWWVLKNQAGMIIALIIIYVDDILLLGEEATIRGIAETIQQVWRTSELAFLTPTTPLRFLGMELEVDDAGVIYVNQRGYIEEILRAHGVPAEAKDKIPLAKDQSSFELLDSDLPSTPEAVTQSQRITGELMWLAQRSRPDIAFTCSLMASITLRSPERCLAIGAKTLRYLQGTKEYRMMISNDGTNLVLYPDAAFAPSSTRSHTGWTVCWSGTPIGWRSSRQSMISLSTAECELQAILDGAVGMIGLEALLCDLDVEPGPKTIASDSTSALAIGSGTGSWRTRHLRLKAAWLQDMVTKGEIVPRHQPGISQPADLLTKALSGQRIQALLDLWGIQTTRTSRASTTSSTLGTRMLVATICCIMMLAVEAEDPQHDRSIRVDWDMAGIFMALLMILGSLVLWEALKWGVVEVYREWTPGASARKLKRLQRLREATTQAIERELERLSEKADPRPTVGITYQDGAPSRESTRMSPSPSTAPQSEAPLDTMCRESTPVRVRSPTPMSSPSTTSQGEEPEDEIQRVSRDLLMLMSCEGLREGLRLEGCHVSGIKEDLASRLGRILAQKVIRHRSPTVKQLRFLLYLWRHRDLSGKVIFTWANLADKQSTSRTIAHWQQR